MRKSLLLIYFFYVTTIAVAQSKTDSTNTEDGLAGPNQVDNLLKEDNGKKQPFFEFGMFQPYFNFKDSLKTKTGFSYSIEYTSIYLAANKSLGETSVAGGMARFYSSWELINRGKKNTGAFIFKGSHRHKYGDITLKNFGFEMGYVGMEVPSFSDDGLRLTNFYWRQRFANDRISMVIGLLDATDFVDVYMLASPWNGFLNFAFSTGSETIYIPNDATLGVGIGAYISKNIYAIASMTDAGSVPTEPLKTVETFFSNKEYFKSFELGWVSSKNKFYHDNVHLTFWHSDGSDVTASLPGKGVAFSATHFLSGKWFPFVRGGFAKDGGTLLQKSAVAGIGFQNKPGASQLGAAFGWGQPNETSFGPGLRDQYTFELFYRLQFSPRFEITPDIQYLINPALNTAETSIIVGGVRGRIIF